MEDKTGTDKREKLERKYARLLSTFHQLQSAAQRVVDETDRTVDNDPWPIKYRAPFGAITELRTVLASQYGLRKPPSSAEREMREALKDAEKRLRGAGMLGGEDDPVVAAITKAAQDPS